MDSVDDEITFVWFDEARTYDQHAIVPVAISSGARKSKDMPWPNARDVGRLGDMSPRAALRVGLDGDNDVYLSTPGASFGGSDGLEFCNGLLGGGRSPRTRAALIALMVAIEQDNANDPSRDWWALRSGTASVRNDSR